MSSEGPKMVGGRYGLAWNGRKTPKSDDTRWPPPPPFAGPIRALPAAAGREILPVRSPHSAPPPWPARVQGWWPVTPPTTKTRLVYKWVKTTQFGVQGFGEFSLGLWSSK